MLSLAIIEKVILETLLYLQGDPKQKLIFGSDRTWPKMVFFFIHTLKKCEKKLGLEIFAIISRGKNYFRG